MVTELGCSSPPRSPPPCGPRLDGHTEDTPGSVPVQLRSQPAKLLSRESCTQLQLPAGLGAGRQGWMEGCCRGVPAALQPVPTGSHGPRVTVCDDCRRSTCRRHCAHVKVCRATSRRVCRSHCTDRPLLARAAGSITIPTGIDRSIGPEQLDSSAVRSACRRAAIVGSCGGHGHTWAWRPHCWCSACACMVMSSCMWGVWVGSGTIGY